MYLSKTLRSRCTESRVGNRIHSHPYTAHCQHKLSYSHGDFMCFCWGKLSKAQQLLSSSAFFIFGLGEARQACEPGTKEMSKKMFIVHDLPRLVSLKFLGWLMLNPRYNHHPCQKGRYCHLTATCWPLMHQISSCACSNVVGTCNSENVRRQECISMLAWLCRAFFRPTLSPSTYVPFNQVSVSSQYDQ